MTPIPEITSSTTAHYERLVSILTATPLEVLEIDILPSSFPPEILHSDNPPSLGVPKLLLIPLFLIARETFFRSLQDVHDADKTRREETRKQALDATAIILLWDPNHITSVNYRKQHIGRLKFEGIPRSTSPKEDGLTRKVVLEQEITFLDSFLTSPLAKHSKSSTLWSYRLWLLTQTPTFYAAWSRTSLCTPSAIGVLTVEDQWRKELTVIMKAGERHPRNYYAWNYARDLFNALILRPDVNQLLEERRDLRRSLALASISKVHHWCLQHPRDISGWSFLIFLLQAGDHAAEGEVCTGSEEETKRVLWETKEFVRKYEWRGESLEWFLKAVDELRSFTALRQLCPTTP